MKYLVLTIAVTALLAACSDGGVSGPDPAIEAPRPEEAAPVDGKMTDIRMDLWPANESPRQGQKPALSITAREVIASSGDPGEADHWKFTGANAVAPAQEAGQSDIHFQALGGSFEAGKRARLAGEVTARMDDMTIYLEDITWEIAEIDGPEARGRAFSNNKLRIDSPTQKLEASSIVIDPETATFELTDVSGDIHFGGMAP